MSKTTKFFLPIIITMMMAMVSQFPLVAQEETEEPTIALVSRVVEIVERRTPRVDWRAAKIGDLLNSGDVVRTGDESFALIRFYDNSLVRLRHRSQLIVYADRDQTGYHRNLELNEGSVTFDVNKREQDRFEFSTPTSVASIRGTSGAFLTLPGNQDILAILSGFANILNRFSMQDQEVRENQYAISDTDGNIIVGDLGDLSDEILELLGLRDDHDGIPQRRLREINIELQNNDGNTMRLILRYEEDDK